MKQQIAGLLARAMTELYRQGVLAEDFSGRIQVERARQRQHGDFACNIAMLLAKVAGMPPRELAGKVVAALPRSELVESVEIAGPGFINLKLASAAYYALIDRIREAGTAYGRSDAGGGQRVMVEFVSANPTGPLHVGHGRGAAYGDALARVLGAAGYDAHSEYYVNDAGRQMHILALSVWLRYLDLCGETVEFPANGYQGDYIWDIGATLHRENGEAYRADAAALFAALPEEDEERIDALVRRCQNLLGEAGYRELFDLGLDALVVNIRTDLKQFGVEYDEWFSERVLVESGAIQQALDVIRDNGHTYEKDGALWFRSTDFGDEKDRVVLRANGSHTYFAADIAYHLNKVQRGFDRLINVWGADHHGYVKRVQAAFEALGHDPGGLTLLLVQFAILYRGGKKVSMSTRGGDFVTLRELREEVGNDAARFFYAMRKPEQHMDFDLDLAKSQSADNPVYYVQYAHARICSVFRQLEEKGLAPAQDAVPDYALLAESHELELLYDLSRFPELIELAARAYEPHQIAYYLRELANRFHTYYNAHPFLASEENMRLARLGLIDATRQVLANGLDLLGVNAPENM
ncbi:MAG: arginine--tRNA ligase [Pseudomonadota bacterium]|nr:arginine--tRNA ligase [Pseudomonadota bacterium]